MSATQSHARRIDEFEIVPDEVDGWDVLKRGEEQSHPTRESAVRTVRLLGGSWSRSSPR